MNIDDLARRVFGSAHDNALPRNFLSRPVPSKGGGGGGRIFGRGGIQGDGFASGNFSLNGSKTF